MTDEIKQFEEFNLDDIKDNDFVTGVQVRALISNSLTNFTEVSRIKSGLLQSGNFVSGSNGWRLDANGDSEMGDGIFRGTITGSTITGGTIQTATSGERIVMTSNTLRAFNASNSIVFDLLGSANESLKLYSDGSKRALTLFENTDATADVVNIGMGAGSGTAINIINNGSNTTKLVHIQTSSGIGFSMVGTNTNGGLVSKLFQTDLDKTGFFFGDKVSNNANNVGLIEIVAGDASGALDTCLFLRTDNDYSHIRFSGSPSPTTNLSDGDFWFDGTDLKLRSGGTTYTLDKTAV